MDAKFGVSTLLDLDHYFAVVIRVLREVILINFLAPTHGQPRSRWPLSKGHNLHSFECTVLTGASTFIIEILDKWTIGVAHERLEALENAIESVENGLESVFRLLIKTRASF
ncbi:hypothetical protein JHK82_044844 [Glycine max]|nr:hypothetical protein JHK82_044844 [Glycine max]